MNTKNRLNRNSIMTGALWLSMLLAMIASMHHVAQQFGSLESAGNEGFGWAAAVAIDAGILSLAYGLRNRRKANRGRGAVARLWVGVGFLTFISISANLSAALTIKPGAWFQALFFSATLPIIVILLSDVVSADDEKAAKRADNAAANDNEVKDLRRQVADLTRHLAEETAKVTNLTDRLAKVTDKPLPSVMTDKTKEAFLTHMTTGNGDRPASVSDIVTQYNVSERTAYRWWQEWQNSQAVSA